MKLWDSEDFFALSQRTDPSFGGGFRPPSARMGFCGGMSRSRLKLGLPAYGGEFSRRVPRHSAVAGTAEVPVPEEKPILATVLGQPPAP